MFAQLPKRCVQIASSPRPIQTLYKGHRFRSRLEARWAVIFDAAGVEWQYEHEGYELGELGRYLPDFWLPELNTHAEVKPSFKKLNNGCDFSIEEKKLLAVCEATRSFGAFCTDLKLGRPVLSDTKWAWDVGAKWPKSVERIYEPLLLQFGEIKYHPHLRGELLVPGGKPFPCPLCGGLSDSESGYGTHFDSTSALTLRGDYEAASHFKGSGIGARGDVMAIRMYCECCADEWYFVFAFHKGTTDVGIIWEPLQDLGPLERVIEPQHIRAGMAARFEHGETP